MNAEETIREALSGAIKSETKRDNAAEIVWERLNQAGHLYEDGQVAQVEVNGARLGVQTVEAYGLVIRLDTSGNAVSVSSPHGFQITETP